MKLERLTETKKRPRQTKAGEALTTEQPTSSEIFDPRIDLPPGELGRIKKWATSHPGTTQEAGLLVQTAWIGWVDPAYLESIQGNPEVKNNELFQVFFDRREGGRLRLVQLPDDPVEAEQWKLTEKAAAYVDFAELVEVFPAVRGELQAPEFADDFQQVLNQAVKNKLDRQPFASAQGITVVNRAQDLKILIQVWPERRQQIIHALDAGDPNMHQWLIEQIQAEASMPHAMAAAADLLVVFPELKPQLEELAKRKRKEIKAKLQEMRADLDEEGESFYRYHRFIKSLTTLGAESAFVDGNGDLQVKLRPLTRPRIVHSLPTRLAA